MAATGHAEIEILRQNLDELGIRIRASRAHKDAELATARAALATARVEIETLRTSLKTNRSKFDKQLAEKTARLVKETKTHNALQAKSKCEKNRLHKMIQRFRVRSNVLFSIRARLRNRDTKHMTDAIRLEKLAAECMPTPPPMSDFSSWEDAYSDEESIMQRG